VDRVLNQHRVTGTCWSSNFFQHFSEWQRFWVFQIYFLHYTYLYVTI